MTIESLSTDRSPTAEACVLDLGTCKASGVLELVHPSGEVSHVWLREGGIYAMQVPGYRPALGIRLLSGGLLSPEQLSSAATVQRDRFPQHRIGQVLIAMGLIDPGVIDGFVRDQVLDQFADLLDLPVDDTAFHPGRRIQDDVIVPAPVGELLSVAHERRARRADALAFVGGAGTVPTLAPASRSTTQTPLGPYDWALLCRVDGQRDITELARVCGYTVHEAAQMVADLTRTGLLALPEPVTAADEPLAPVVALRPDAPLTPTPPQWQFDGTDAGEPEPVDSLLAEFSAFVRDDAATGTAAPPPCGNQPPAVGVTADEAPAAVPTPQPTAEPAPESGAAAGAAVTAPADPPAPASEPPAAPPAPVAPAPAPAPAAMFPPGAPVAPPDSSGYSDTSVFMRELSSLSDDPDQAPEVTRLVVPFTEPRRKRRFWPR